MTDTALLVIDMQEGFRSKTLGYYTPMLNQILPKVKRLIDNCREKGYLIIYLQYCIDKKYQNISDYEFKALNINNSSVRICKEIKPLSNDLIIQKHTYSGFIETKLKEVLKKHKIKKLIFSGVSTNACVRSTLYDAYDYGYHCIIIEDCVGGNESEHKNALITFKRHLDKAEFKELREIKQNKEMIKTLKK